MMAAPDYIVYFVQCYGSGFRILYFLNRLDPDPHYFPTPGSGYGSIKNGYVFKHIGSGCELQFGSGSKQTGFGFAPENSLWIRLPGGKMK